MNSREEKKKLRNAKWRYFFAGVVSYITVYVICILIMKMVQMLFPFPPYVELICLLLFFAVSSWFTKRIVRLQFIMQWVRL